MRRLMPCGEIGPESKRSRPPLLAQDLAGLLGALNGKLEPDGSLSDHASPELARLRRSMTQQQRAIEASLRRALAKMSDDGSTQDSLITVRGERFVIPVKTEFRRKVGGVVHGLSSSGQTVFVEPIETIEHNNELARLLDAEQAEVHRILVAMTRTVAEHAVALKLGAAILAEVDGHQAIAKFAADFVCVRPSFAIDGAHADTKEREGKFALTASRHPLLEIRLRLRSDAIVPLTIEFPNNKTQLVISGPNTGGKTVALKTAGLLALMAQAGLPVPAEKARLPLFESIYADIGDAQSIEQSLSTFSAHVINWSRIAGVADIHSLVLLDELGSATDPEEGAALAVAVAEHFLERKVWCIITTHLTSLKIYAAKHEAVMNAAVGFDEDTLSPTYELRLGVPGASAGLNIAARLGLDPAIVSNAHSQLTTQQIDIGRFLDDLHAQLTAAAFDRDRLRIELLEVEEERRRLEQFGRLEQQARTRELEKQLTSLLLRFELELRDATKALEDKTVAQKMTRESALRMAQLKREFSAQFQSVVNAHTASSRPRTGATDANGQRAPRAGDTVRVQSLNREGRVVRVIDAVTFEVAVGAMKMRVALSDLGDLEANAGKSLAVNTRHGHRGISFHGGSEVSVPRRSEINVIGKTADEAESEVDRFVEQAFLAGMSTIRVVHGVGMGVLRRTLREFLVNHPHVTSISEPPHNQGGQGVTLVELRS